MLLAMLSFGAAIGASGCTPQETPSPPTPSTAAAASAAPVLPSNEEALAIVEELVRKASTAESDARTSGSYAELEAIASSQYVSQVRTSNEELAAEGLVVTGNKEVDSLQIQSVVAADGLASIQSYGCYDISGTQLTNSAGENARSPDVPMRVPVVFRVEGISPNFRLMETLPWSGPSSC
ncbi:hypothetical protein C5B85_16910 [Pseudoclavibacter sp. AY1F1]|nr:hypothetical protein C5B85_16910 [Pseudoclavibacter sp. AY1F1]